MKTYFSDSANFLFSLSLRKIFNYFKLRFSFYLTRISGKYFHSGLPYSLSIELTNKCNLHCIECPTGQNLLKRNKGNIEKIFFNKIIDQSYPSLSYLMLYFQGEPYLHSDLFNFISYAHEKNIYTATSTNAHFLDEVNAQRTVESGLDRLIISMDGTTQETYSKYREGGSLEKVITGIKNIQFWKKKLNSKKPFVILQFLVSRENEHQISAIRKIAGDLSVDRLELKTLQICNFEKNEAMIPQNHEFSRYRKDSSGNYVLKKEIKNKCWRSWSSTVITWDGDVIPCCFDKDADFKMGNVNIESIDEIFTNKLFQDYRKKIIKDRSDIDMCRNCTE